MYDNIVVRSSYMAKEISHEAYFGQFVNDLIYRELEPIKQQIIDSKDEHFNDIPLRFFDNLPLNSESARKVTFANTGKEPIKSGFSVQLCLSSSDKVCIYKEACRRLRGF